MRSAALAAKRSPAISASTASTGRAAASAMRILSAKKRSAPAAVVGSGSAAIFCQASWGCSLVQRGLGTEQGALDTLRFRERDGTEAGEHACGIQADAPAASHSRAAASSVSPCAGGVRAAASVSYCAAARA